LKKEALKEIGKGFINIGNGIIILTIVNGLFNSKLNTPLPVVGGCSFILVEVFCLTKGLMMSNLVLTYIGVGIVAVIALIFAILVKPEK